MKTITVGVDARLLSRPLTGIGRYTMELCQALSKRTDIDLILYSPAPVKPYFDKNAQLTVKHSQWHNGIAKQYWFETVLPRWAKKDNLDVFWGPAHRLPRQLSPSIARIVTIHDLVWKFASATMQTSTWLLEKYFVPFAIQSADTIIADCHTSARIIEETFSDHAKKVRVLFPGAKRLSTPFLPPIQLATQLAQPFFLFIGTMEPRKNLSRLLTAYSMLPQSTKDRAMLVIAGGEGWGNFDIEKKIVQLNLINHVKILGYVDEQKLAWLYSNALFLAFPSLYEGFGLPLIEAMSYGLPVLTSTTSCMPEISQAAGLLVDPFDEEAICVGLHQLIHDAPLRQQLASCAQIIAAPYDWHHAAECLMNEFHQAIDLRRGLV